MSVNTGNTNAQCIQFDLTYGVEFPCISGVEGGGTAINNTYGIGAYPTYILIAPDHSIVEQDIWPVPTAQTFITTFESNGVMASECGGMNVNFTADETEICQYDQVAFTDQSAGSVSSWNWTFEGGDPATSTEQNPVVTYNESGTFDVELEVSDGTTTTSKLMEDYITAETSPPVMLSPFDDVCLNWPAFALSGGSPAGGVYAGPGVVDNWFYPADAGLGTHMISYTYTALSGCDNTTEQALYVDECVGIDVPAQADFAVYPNPSNGIVTMSVVEMGNYSVRIYNVLGTTLIEDEIYFNQNRKQTLNLQNLEGGMYFIEIQSDGAKQIQKIRISGK